MSYPVQKAPPKEMNFHDKKYLIIDSRDRDRSLYPLANHFKVDLNSPLKNIVDVILKRVIVPVNLAQQRFIYMEIAQFENYESPVSAQNNTYAQRSIARLIPKETYNSFTTCDIYPEECIVKLQYGNRIPRLDKLEVYLRNPDGTLCSTGADNAVGSDPNEDVQVLIEFAVVCENSRLPGQGFQDRG